MWKIINEHKNGGVSYDFCFFLYRKKVYDENFYGDFSLKLLFENILVQCCLKLLDKNRKQKFVFEI